MVKKKLTGRYRVYDAVFYVKDNHITGIEKITHDGFEVPGHLYISDGPKTRSYTRINHEKCLFTTVRSGMYKGNYMVN